MKEPVCHSSNRREKKTMAREEMESDSDHVHTGHKGLHLLRPPRPRVKSSFLQMDPLELRGQAVVHPPGLEVALKITDNGEERRWSATFCLLSERLATLSDPDLMNRWSVKTDIVL